MAVFGAGPVGLLASYVSVIKGASEVYTVDRSPKRLDFAKSVGAIPINFEEGDPVDQIRNMRRENAVVQQNLHPEEYLSGVECAIDAVGYQAVDRKDPSQQNSTQVISDISRVINPAGHLGIIGDYLPADPMGKTEDDKNGILHIPFGVQWNHGVSIGAGQAPIKNYHNLLRDLIINGKARPSFIVSDRIGIDDAPDAYAEFDKRDEVTKPVIMFK